MKAIVMPTMMRATATTGKTTTMIKMMTIHQRLELRPFSTMIPMSLNLMPKKPEPKIQGSMTGRNIGEVRVPLLLNKCQKNPEKYHQEKRA